jgi:hypothetical protein
MVVKPKWSRRYPVTVETSRFKSGHNRHNPKNTGGRVRIASLRTGLGGKVICECALPDPGEHRSSLHAAFSAYRKGN